MATNGRGNILRCAMVWRWQDAGAMQYLDRSSTPPDWIVVVPVSMDRPSWVPMHAKAHALHGDETAYTWRDAA